MNPNNAQNTLSVVYKKAAMNKPVLDGLLQKVAQRSGAKAISNYKSPDTAVSKVSEKNDEDSGRNYQLKDVNDVARGRLVYNSYDAMRKGIDTFKQQAKQSGVKIAKEQDFFKKPEDGYRGYHVDLAFPNGQHSEVQFHTPQSYANTLATHEAHAQYGDEMPAQIKEGKEAVGNEIMKLPNQSATQIATAKEVQNVPMQAQAQAAAQQVIQSPSSQDGFDIPNLMAKPPMQQAYQSQAAFPPSKGGTGMGKTSVTPQMLAQATSLLKGKLTLSDIQTIGQFAEKVETGKDKGNLGQTGKTMQSFAENVFGKQAANWSNKQVKNAFDMVVKGAYK